MDEIRDIYFDDAEAIFEDYFEYLHAPSTSISGPESFDGFLEHFVKLSCLLEITLEEKPPSLPVRRSDAVEFIVDYFRAQKLEFDSRHTEKKHADLRRSIMEGYHRKIPRLFVYEFSEGDLQEIQDHINNLRAIINDSKDFDDDYRHRLLNRLELLQRELHKRMSNLDRFWGLLGETGVALGKFGDDAKPFVDRVRELVDVVWRTQARAEELPSRAPLPELEKPEDG